ANHLIALRRVDAQRHVDLDRLIELGPLDLLEQGDGLFERRGASLGDLLVVVFELIAQLLAAARRTAGLLSLFLRARGDRGDCRRRGGGRGRRRRRVGLGRLGLGSAWFFGFAGGFLGGGRRWLFRCLGGFLGLFLGHDGVTSRLEILPTIS